MVTILSILGSILVPLLLWRWKSKAALIYLGVYVTFYALLSLRGNYVERIEAGADGSQTWYPLWCENRTPGPSGRIKTGPSDFGLYFWPLLFIDQGAVHREVRPYKVIAQHAVLMTTNASDPAEDQRYQIIRSLESFTNLAYLNATDLQKLTNFNFSMGILAATFSAEVKAAYPLIGNTVVIELEKTTNRVVVLTEIRGDTNTFFKFTWAKNTLAH